MQERAEKKRQRAIEEGVQALIASGYRGTGLQEILDRAGIPKGSFYNYFASKEDFGRAAIEHYAASFSRELAARLAPGEEDPLDQLRNFFAAMIERFASEGFTMGCLVGNLAAEVADGSETCRLALQDATRAWRALFREVIERGQSRGSIRDDVAAEELADFVLNAWEGSLLRMKVEKSSEPLEQCSTMLFDRMLNRQ